MMIKNILDKFKKQSEEELVTVDDRSVVVSVPDIKEYLVKEYDRSNSLQLHNEYLEQTIEKYKETEMKYDATLVTLDQYSKRLEKAEDKISEEKKKTEAAKQETASIRDELNAYKIKFNNAAITKQEIKDEIVKETKQAIMDQIFNHKGNLSKQAACEIILNTTVNIEE